MWITAYNIHVSQSRSGKLQHLNCCRKRCESLLCYGVSIKSGILPSMLHSPKANTCYSCCLPNENLMRGFDWEWLRWRHYETGTLPFCSAKGTGRAQGKFTHIHKHLLFQQCWWFLITPEKQTSNLLIQSFNFLIISDYKITIAIRSNI